MREINKLLYGSTYSNKEDRFERGIIKLEKKHHLFFEGKASLFFKGEDDHLEEHLNRYYIGNAFSLAFDIKSDLPHHIRIEVISLFHKIWGTINHLPKIR
jgi:hypothetical protein